eukprot:TRINITY_DN73914_c1_g1_i1.p1 TRINITY_DN73914_c1_g1~~TRINITY_DN73914_c1_g1_i1.p1  ORF type:complete len:528 (+),score=12.29 TRINITY_DN73914_c1_g1_i1:117-1700(+)
MSIASLVLICLLCIGLVESTDHNPPPPDGVCAHGYEQHGHDCVKRHTLPLRPNCPHGSIYSTASGSGSCVSKTIVSLGSSCAPGYEPGALGRCFRETTTEAVSKCPSGYERTQNHNMCHLVKTAESTNVCGLGFHYGSDGSCARTTSFPPTPLCHHGYHFHAGVCITKIREPKITRCPGNYHPSGPHNCEKLEKITARAYCPNGGTVSSANRAECVTKHVVKTDSICTGETGPHGRCIHREYAEKEATCALGLELDPAVGMCKFCEFVHHHPGQDHGFIASTSDTSGECKYHDPKLTCPHGYFASMEDSSCIRTSPAEVLYSCPKHYEEQGVRGPLLQCVKRSIYGSSSSCENSYTQSGDTCSRTVSSPMISYCNDEYVLSPDTDECIKVLTEPPTMVCDSGEFGDHGLLCHETVVQNAEVVCPLGYELTTRGDCMRTTERPLVLACEHPSFKVDRERNICVRLEDVQAHSYCPDGYDAAHGQCVMFKHYAVEYDCPTGYDIEDGDSCVKVDVRPIIKPRDFPAHHR